MARVTVEDALVRVTDQFALVHLTALRYRQLHRGSQRYVECKNKNIVTALREVAAGHVRFREDVTEVLNKVRRRMGSMRPERSMGIGGGDSGDLPDEIDGSALI